MKIDFSIVSVLACVCVYARVCMFMSVCVFRLSDGRSGSSDRVECVNPHRHNATLQTLDLRYNKIGDVGAAAIGEGLRCVQDCCRTMFLMCFAFARPACAVMQKRQHNGFEC